MEIKKREPAKDKVETVKRIAKLIDERETIMFVYIGGLPARQFQKIKKMISKDTEVIVARKKLLLKAIDMSKKPNISLIKDYVRENNAMLISNIDCFELATRLSESKSPIKAKIGQEAPEDIEVEAGPTELTPGPIVSELGSLGIKIEIKGGKIEIKESKVIVKKGQKINEASVSIMNKLNIMPFYVGFIPIAAYDSKSGKVFKELVINKSETLKNLKNSFIMARNFAVSISYITKETIGLLIAKAYRHEKAIESKLNLQIN